MNTATDFITAYQHLQQQATLQSRPLTESIISMAETVCNAHKTLTPDNFTIFTRRTGLAGPSVKSRLDLPAFPASCGVIRRRASAETESCTSTSRPSSCIPTGPVARTPANSAEHQPKPINTLPSNSHFCSSKIQTHRAPVYNRCSSGSWRTMHDAANHQGRGGLGSVGVRAREGLVTAEDRPG